MGRLRRRNVSEGLQVHAGELVIHSKDDEGSVGNSSHDEIVTRLAVLADAADVPRLTRPTFKHIPFRDDELLPPHHPGAQHGLHCVAITFPEHYPIHIRQEQVVDAVQSFLRFGFFIRENLSDEPRPNDLLLLRPLFQPRTRHLFITAFR